MTAPAVLTAWRAEISAEIEPLELELAPLRQQLAEAEREAERLRTEQAALEVACARGLGFAADGLAGSVYGRLQSARFSTDQQVSRLLGPLLGRVRAIEQSIAGRRLALAQIDRALAAEQPRPVREVVPRPRPAAVSPFVVEA